MRLGVLPRVKKILDHKTLARVKKYAEENWGAPFVLGFALLLVFSTAFLVMNLGYLANEVAIYAYCALVVGVFLNTAYLIKYAKRNGEKYYGSS